MVFTCALVLALGICSCATESVPRTRLADVSTVYQFPLGSWLENIAVRQNGNLLLTRLDVAEIYQIDPTARDAQPQLVASLPEVTSVFGIAAIAHDVFTFSAGNSSFSDSSVSGDWSIRKLDFNTCTDHRLEVSKIADVPEVFLLNGMTVLPASGPPHQILSGDIGTGVIYCVSPDTGAVSVAVNTSLTATAASAFGETGVNGIHIHPSRPDILYLANTGQHILASVPIDPSTGTPTGKGSVIANVTARPGVFTFDDFALPHDLDEDDAAYVVTSSGNTVERIPLSGPDIGQRQLVAGDLNSTVIAGPTSAAFGRTRWDGEVLYVVTGGAQVAPVNGDETVGAQVLAVDVGRWRKWQQGDKGE